MDDDQARDDSRIIERVRGGEIDAFATIIQRYQQEVWRIAAHALRDVAATEDLVQQVFVSAYLNLDRYTPATGADDGFGPWLRTLARNEVRKAIRTGVRDARKRRLYGDWLVTRLEARAKAADGRGLDDEQLALRRALAGCREGLAPTASRALCMRYDEARGFEAIAASLGRTVAATRQLLSRVRIALRECVEKRIGPTRPEAAGTVSEGGVR